MQAVMMKNDAELETFTKPVDPRRGKFAAWVHLAACEG